MKHEEFKKLLREFIELSETPEPAVSNKKPKFAETNCSQCGADLGPGDAGTSHCDEHPDVERGGSYKDKPVHNGRYWEQDDPLDEEDDLDEEDISGMQLSIGGGKADVHKPKQSSVDPRKKEPSKMDFGGYKFEGKKNKSKKKKSLKKKISEAFSSDPLGDIEREKAASKLEPRKGPNRDYHQLADDTFSEEIAELSTMPEFQDVNSFISTKLENEEYEFTAVELQALAKNVDSSRLGYEVDRPGSTIVKQVKSDLVDMGFNFIVRGIAKATRGHKSSAHGTHPFAGSGGGGSGFGSDFEGGTFTSFGGGPGAMGGGYKWNKDDPKNLPMGSKRK